MSAMWLAFLLSSTVVLADPGKKASKEANATWVTEDIGFRKLCQGEVLDQVLGLSADKRLQHDTCIQRFPETNLELTEASVFCSKWLPYKVVSATSDDKGTLCKWKAYRQCASHEVAIYDACFWVTKPLPFEIGRRQCPTGSRFAKIISREQVNWLKFIYGQRISAVWVSNRVEKKEYQKTSGAMNYDDYEWDTKAGGYVQKTKSLGTILPLQENGIRNGLVGTLVKAAENSTYPTLCVRYPVSRKLFYPGEPHRKCLLNFGKCSLFKTRNVYTHSSVGLRNVTAFHQTCKQFCKTCFAILPEMLEEGMMREILQRGEKIHVPIKLADNLTIANHKPPMFCASQNKTVTLENRLKYEIGYLEKPTDAKHKNPLNDSKLWLPEYPMNQCSDVMPWALAYGYSSAPFSENIGLLDLPPILRFKLVCVYVPDPEPTNNQLEEVAENVAKVHKAHTEKSSRAIVLFEPLIALLILNT